MDRDDSRYAKRFRSESGTGVRAGNDEQSDSFSHKLAPSAVVHVRGLPDHVRDTDLHEAVINFGPVSYVIQIPNRNMALIEFESVESATSLVNYAQSNTVCVLNKPALFNYSTSTRIKRPESSYVPVPNCVILLTILNARYPITVEVISAVCAPYGTVQRIVIFRKNGVQAMVEYDSIEAATEAKNGLHGQDIYSDCCSIKADFAKPTTLNVKRNDADTWDFTVCQVVRESTALPQPKNQPLLANPRYGTSPMPFAPGYFGASFATYGYPPGTAYGTGDTGRRQPSLATSGSGAGFSAYGGSSYSNAGHQDSYPSPMALLSAYESQSIASTSGANADCVLMIYGMDGKKFNCQRLFNLLCIYGTIIKIKFLKTKEGSAMVQMGDRDSCDRVIRNLHGATCFGSRFSISMSKQSFLQDVINPHQLPDGSEGYANYIGSRNQRYTSPDAAAKNRPVPPTTALYFYNAPPNVSEDVLMEAVTDAGAVRPTKICIFPPKSDKSSRGLMQWHNVEDCIEALVLANHAPISNSTASRNPFILKLAFSQSALD